MNRDEVQPYFKAFMIERGYTDTSEADTTDYMEWNQDRWREFSRLRGFDISQRPFHREAFGEWLEARSLDFAAREHVEAA